MPISRKLPPEITRAIEPQQHGLVKAAYAHLPAIQGRAGELIPGFGNIGQDDITVARLKVLQGMSPECKPDGGSHPQGKFYQTTAARTIGTDLIVMPLNVRRSVELWDNRDSGGGLLARSEDGIHWDKPHAVFMIKNRKGEVIKCDTKGSVQESGLAEFGSSEPGNSRSAPMASITYRYSLFLEDYASLGVSMLILSRTQTEAAKDLNNRVNARVVGGTPFYAQRYNLRIGTKKSGPNEWYVPLFENAGDVEDVRLAADLQMRAAALHRASKVSAVDEDAALDEDKRQYTGVDRSQNSSF